jgi:hypothetical protein
MQIPDEAVQLAVEAIMGAQNANDGEPERFEATLLARVALEAAAPILAEAWGVARRKPGTTRDPRARVTCRRCGAQPGQQCITSSGTAAPMVHAERRNDWRRAEGQTAGLEQEGMYMDRFPPPPRG